MRVLLVITDVPPYEATGYADAWTRALREQGAEVDRLAGLPAQWATTGPPAYDLVVAHVLVEEVAALAPTLLAATVLETTGARLLNPVASLVTSSDKLATHAVWAGAGLPQPATWALEDLRTWPAGRQPLVLKPSLCDGARHIRLVRDLEEARAAVRAWREDEAAGGERRGAALLQERVEEPRCVRLFATPDDVSLAYEKARRPGELLTHGTTYPRSCTAPAAMADLARSMVSSLGGGLMGVDVLVRPDGALLALEANGPFGFDVTDPEQGRWVARSALARASVSAG